MPGPGEINGSQPFKLTVESFNRPHNVAGVGARANASAPHDANGHLQGGHLMQV